MSRHAGYDRLRGPRNGITSTRWQLAHRAAERYACVLVPTIREPAARELIAWSTLGEGETVVDVGCGSGAAPRDRCRRSGVEAP